MQITLNFNSEQQSEIDTLMNELNIAYPKLMSGRYMEVRHVLHTATMEGVCRRIESLRKLAEMERQKARNYVGMRDIVTMGGDE